LVSRARDENILLHFRAAFIRAFGEPAGQSPGELAGAPVLADDYDVGVAHQVPAGPDVVGLAIAPPLRLTVEHVAALPRLRVAAAAATGYDHLDVAALAAAGVQVAHTPGYCDVEVADHAIAMTVALLRSLHAGDASVRAGVWSSRAVGAKRITGSVLGVVGLGRTGALVAARAAALGMRVLAWAPRTSAARAGELGVTPVATLAELLRASDVVSLHVPLTPDTKNLIDADALALMQPGAALVNCGRGELVDLGALHAALESGQLGGAALDVLDTEPPPEDHIAFALPRTIITPHLAWLSPESEYASYEMTAVAIAAVLRGQSPRHVVGKQG
jgi:D-3-phosphoglycerate dehydrogenase / 2-oxoglutarate reductase